MKSKYFFSFGIKSLRYSLALIFIAGGANVTKAQTWAVVGNPGFSTGEPSSTTILIDKNGTPYVAYSDYSLGYKAVVKKYSDGWVTVGSQGFSLNQIGEISFAIDSGGTPYVAFTDGGFQTPVTVMKYDSSSWVVVGSRRFSIDSATALSLAIDRSGMPYVAYGEYSALGGLGKITVMKYNDSSWVTVGAPRFSADIGFGCSMAIDTAGTPYVFYPDVSHSLKATVMKYNGSNWVNVGEPGFSADGIDYPSIAIGSNGKPYVVYAEGDSSKAAAMQYNGSDWINLGSPGGFSTHGARYTTIAINHEDTPYVTYMNYDVGTATGGGAVVMKYNGSNWITVGNPNFSPDYASGWNSIAIDSSGTPYIAYDDFNHLSNITVEKLEVQTGIKSTAKPATMAAVIYPNPNDGVFTIDLSPSTFCDENAQIVVTNILGEKIYEGTILTYKKAKLKLDAPPGIYFLTALTSQNTQSVKLVIQ